MVVDDHCSFNRKNCVVIQESLGKAAASYLTILEVAVDEHYCTHSLVYLWSVCIDFIMWSLSVTILLKIDLGLLSGTHTFGYSFNEAVSCRIVFVCSQWESWLPHGANQINTDLRRCHGCLYPETNRTCWSRDMLPRPFGLEANISLGD